MANDTKKSKQRVAVETPVEIEGEPGLGDLIAEMPPNDVENIKKTGEANAMRDKIVERLRAIPGGNNRKMDAKPWPSRYDRKWSRHDKGAA